MLSRRCFLTAVLLCTVVSLSSCGKAEEIKKPFYSSDEPEKGEKAPAPSSHIETLLSIQEAFIGIAENVTPAVVNISTVQANHGRRRFPFQVDPFFRDFFGDSFDDFPDRSYEGKSLGSGAIINPEGYIITNYHVIKDAEEITVKLSDKSEYKGKVVGIDPKTDIAVIKIAAGKELPFAMLGDSDKIKVGQWAIAIGNPFGLDRTFTVGVISATGRSEVGLAAFESFIQTDASINPGNSGGPLLDVQGQVVGINTAIVATGQGIGFAIPVNMAKGVVEDLIRTGKVTRGWLGVGIQPLTKELAESFELKDTKGVLINSIFPESPAGRAGLKTGDIIKKFDEKSVDDPKSLQTLVASAKTGSTVAVEIIRDLKPLVIKIMIDEMPQDEEIAAAMEESDWLGLVVVDIPEEAAGVQAGIYVKDVKKDSFAGDAGIREGDIILSVNKLQVNYAKEYKKIVSGIKKGSYVSLLIRRDGGTLYIAFNTRG